MTKKYDVYQGHYKIGEVHEREDPLTDTMAGVGGSLAGPFGLLVLALFVLGGAAVLIVEAVGIVANAVRFLAVPLVFILGFLGAAGGVSAACAKWPALGVIFKLALLAALGFGAWYVFS